MVSTRRQAAAAAAVAAAAAADLLVQPARLCKVASGDAVSCYDATDGCSICALLVRSRQQKLVCSTCFRLHHRTCTAMEQAEYRARKREDTLDAWTCHLCEAAAAQSREAPTPPGQTQDPVPQASAPEPQPVNSGAAAARSREAPTPPAQTQDPVPQASAPEPQPVNSGAAAARSREAPTPPAQTQDPVPQAPAPEPQPVNSGVVQASVEPAHLENHPSEDNVLGILKEVPARSLGVLLRALSEYKFVGHPLCRMADGKDHVPVELTFHKKLPTQPVFKKRAESRRQPAPSTGEWPCQPTAARRPPPTRSTPTVQLTVRQEAPEETTASTTDTGNYTRHHQSFKITTHSTAYTISMHQGTSYTDSFSRDFTCKETENEVAKVYK